MRIKDLIEKVRDKIITSNIGLQRNIVYNSSKQEKVIDSVVSGVPLPSFYLWETTSKETEGRFEVIDGKQRIEALISFFNGDIQYKNKPFGNYDNNFKEKIYNVDLKIIICKGDGTLKRKIFNRINTLGVPLSKFEVKNGLYNGEYLNGIKPITRTVPIQRIYGNNSRGKIQLEILNVLKRVKEIDDIDKYLEANQYKSFNPDYNKIRPYINFVSDVFYKYKHKEILFQLSIKYLKNKSIWNAKRKQINNAIKNYLESDDYKLSKDKSKDYEEIIISVVENLSVDPKRIFTQNDKLIFVKQFGLRCSICSEKYLINELVLEHKIPWLSGGQTTITNAQLLCRIHKVAFNREKKKKLIHK